MNKIMHFGHYNHKDNGSFTVVSTVENNFVEYGVAFCSPKDTFCKKTGVKLATDRLVAMNDTGIFKQSGMAIAVDTTHVDVTFAILASIASSNIAPDWARPLVIDELIDYSFKSNDSFYINRQKRRSKLFKK